MISTLSKKEGNSVLIVDDHVANLKGVEIILSMTGLQVRSASTAQQALNILKDWTPDLILLDVLMPDMDGLELCRLIKSLPNCANLPIIFLSAADDKNLIVQALETGGVDYVTKPFHKAELLSRVRTHLALKQARDQLKYLAEDKDELLGIMAHDLKNHLAGMSMSLGLLQSYAKDLPDKMSNLVGNITQSTEAMILFVREFLANQSAERLSLQLQTVDLNGIVAMAYARHQVIAEAKGMTLQWNAPNQNVLVTADHAALGRVLDNLISNAIKFTQIGGEITLRVTPNVLSWSSFSVEDNGPGFTQEDETRMFRRYSRLSARPTAGEPSSGLGLSIVKRLIEQMNGKIYLNKQYESGSCFVVQLPNAS